MLKLLLVPQCQRPTRASPFCIGVHNLPFMCDLKSVISGVERLVYPRENFLCVFHVSDASPKSQPCNKSQESLTFLLPESQQPRNGLGTTTCGATLCSRTPVSQEQKLLNSSTRNCGKYRKMYMKLQTYICVGWVS